MSPPRPPNVHAESTAELEHHLAAAKKRGSELAAELCAAAFVETVDEARVIFDVMKNDAHVLNLREKRAELEFVLRRQKDIGIDIASFKSESES